MRINFIFLLLLPIAIYAQKEDHIWLIGYDADAEPERFGTTILDFNRSPVNIYEGFSLMNFQMTNTSVCNENGELLFYTNGIDIRNGNHEIVAGGRSLMSGEIGEEDQERGLRYPQNAVTVRKPASDSLYYLLYNAVEPHIRADTGVVVGIHSSQLSYTIIDVKAVRGRGLTVEKDVILKKDTLSSGHLTGVKHANGRDWWFLNTEYKQNRFYKYLLTPNGINEVESQSVGSSHNTGFGQSVFSPDGTKYVRYMSDDIYDGGFINIYDFDRCSGLLSNPQIINVQDTAYALGAAISSNSQFLYISSYNYVYQFDLLADSIELTKDTVAIYDGFYFEHPLLRTPFNQAQLAPDGKIYISAPNSVPYYHVIHRPDEKGDKCYLEQHGVRLPTYNAFSIPNHPNYRLGTLAGSPCDTIREVTNTTQIKDEFKISTYPNPVYTQLTVDLTLSNYEKLSKYHLEIHNLYGQVIEKRQLREYTPIYRFEMGDLPRGVYFVNLYQGEKVVAVQKVVVQ